MNNLCRLVVLVSLFSFPRTVAAQVPPDTQYFQICHKFWKTGELVPDCRFDVNYSTECLSAPLFIHVFDTPKPCDSILYIKDTCSQIACFQSINSKHDDRNGITVADISYIIDHLLGYDSLYGFARRAADVNWSNSVTSFDIIELRKLILGIYPGLPGSPSWRPMVDTLLPIDQKCFDFSSSSETDTFSFTMVKMGDVDGDANLQGSYQIPQDHPIAFSMPDWTVSEGAVIWAPLSFTEPVHLNGIQFALHFDTTLIDLTDVSFSLGVNSSNTTLAYELFDCVGICFNKYANFQNGNFSYQTPFMMVKFKALATFQLRDAFWFSNNRTYCLWSDSTYAVHPIDTLLQFTSSVEETGNQPFKIGVPTPNPYSTTCSIPIELDTPQRIVLEIWSLEGKILMSKIFDFSEGDHQIEFGSDLPVGHGMIHYRLSGSGASISGKLIRQ